jgi:sarcosine oxidase subunit gamma
MTLSENPGLALASVAARLGHEVECAAYMADLLGRDAPDPGKACLRDPEAAFWMGPDQWMVSAPYASHEDLAVQLKSRFGATASITEQSDAWACFDLQGPEHGPEHGPEIERVMELLCPLNLRQMQTGDATRTVIHHLGCFVIRQDPPEHLRILGPRASAGSLHHGIVEAMGSVL